MKMLKSKFDFRKENQKNWEKNSTYWLNNPLRQVEDTQSFFKKKLLSLVKPNMTIIDMGCGSAWLLEFLLELDIDFKYIGLDFNPIFIKHLKNKYHSKSNVEFIEIDFEEGIPKKLIQKADIVFNLFTFFENSDLDTAFSNAHQMLKANGELVIFTIDCIFLILAVSRNMEEFKEKLKMYEEIKSTGEVPYFFQNIDLGDAESEDLKYASVLYSFDDYYKQANLLGMKLSDYGEVVKTSKFLPKTYQYMVFK
ncbi:MAG: class I SAM-dependent methyltransferase [Altibacter sp.]|uniref:class I SAM-dependent methyltransferase n=1 Tax=Altibacter sp. TaxID=2024823 RepID=UPI001D92AAD4|nr:class I SAM-dependent methyltransferase [Altibacter sp.]MBZ0328288.1 class I SAM-dependent methyltransferase [Altibacter sp.]